MIVIIGDRFMRAACFVDHLRQLGITAKVTTYELPWPDAPMEHGYAVAGMEGLQEYQGQREQILRWIGDAEILITHLAPLSASMLAVLPALKFCAVSRGGPVNIDREAARQKGMVVVNVPGRNASAVAEFTVGAILSQTRHIAIGHEALRRGQWRGDLYRYDKVGRELSQLVVGIVGYGHVGRRVVALLKPFGGHLLVHDPYVTLDDGDRRDGVASVSFAQLLAESDVISLHARVTPETRGFINANALAQMKRGVCLVNTARGPLVDYPALQQALQEGHVGGAMLETFADEPPSPDEPLLQCEQVTLSPHIAGASQLTVMRAAESIAREVARYMQGQQPLNPC